MRNKEIKQENQPTFYDTLNATDEIVGTLEERLLQVTNNPGVPVSFTQEEAYELGFFQETALTEREALESWCDEGQV